MAKLTREDILKLAKLARLQLTDSEVAQFTEEISAILQYVEQLQNLELEDVEPTYQVTGLKNIMRPDEVYQYQASPDDLLKNVPEKEGRHIKVRKML